MAAPAVAQATTPHVAAGSDAITGTGRFYNPPFDPNWYMTLNASCATWSCSLSLRGAVGFGAAATASEGTGSLFYVSPLWTGSAQLGYDMAVAGGPAVSSIAGGTGSGYLTASGTTSDGVPISLAGSMTTEGGCVVTYPAQNCPFTLAGTLTFGGATTSRDRRHGRR